MSKNLWIGSMALIMVAWASAGWAAGNLTGIVTDQSGKPISGVMVSAFDADAEMGVTVFSGMDGKFKISGLADRAGSCAYRGP